MAKREQFTMSQSERRRRTFSDNFKKEKVKEVEMGYTKVSQICKQYQVSDVSVYRWMTKFGSMKKKERIVIESKSDTAELLELKKKVAELEQIIGQKQVLIDFQQKMIDLAQDHYQVDIKKKFSTSPSNSTGKKEKR